MDGVPTTSFDRLSELENSFLSALENASTAVELLSKGQEADAQVVGRKCGEVLAKIRTCQHILREEAQISPLDVVPRPAAHVDRMRVEVMEERLQVAKTQLEQIQELMKAVE